MCSLTEDVMYENTPNLKNINFKMCKKCEASEPAIVLRKIDVYCKSCFLAATNHKFRLMLGKYRVVKPNDNVLINHQIGHPSTALLHFIHEGLNLTHHKKFRFKPIFLFIDENYKLNKNERLELIKNINEQFSSYDFTLHFTSLKNNDDESNYYNFKDYCSYIENEDQNHVIKDSEIIDVNRRNLIVNISKKLKCPVVFSPEICVDVAVGILCNVALGRGSQIPLNVGIIDDRYENTIIFKPLRLFEMKELAYYNFFNALPIVSVPKIKLNDNALNATVQSLMKNFIEGLQVNFPATITTITRTGDKLSCNKNGGKCKYCKAPVEVQESLSSSEATEFSKWISIHSSNNIEEFVSRNKNNNTCFACSKIYDFESS